MGQETVSSGGDKTMKDRTQGTQDTADGTPERVWAPCVGEKVRLRALQFYTDRGVRAWDTLTVTAVQDAYVTVQLGENGQLLDYMLSALETPIGWKDQYTITVGADKVEEVLGWFRDKRGIAVLQSHYMPGCPTAFAPADNQGADWRFNGADRDVIAAADCDRLFRVVKLETWYDMSMPSVCEYCEKGKRTREKNAVLVGHDTERCPHCGVIAGFSFDEPYHPKGYRYGYVEGMAMDDSQCAQTRPAAECWVCGGTGVGKRYLSQMGAKEKESAKRELTRQRWKLTYVRSGDAMWVGERETVVKDFGQSVPPIEVTP